MKIDCTPEELKELMQTKTSSAGTPDVKVRKVILQDIDLASYLHNYLGQLLQEKLSNGKSVE